MWWIAVAVAAAEPGCDAAAIDALTAKLRAGGGAAALSAAWSGLCTTDAWHDVAAEVGQLGDPVRVRLVELQLAVSRAHLLPEVCVDPMPAPLFSQASKMGEREGRRLLFERCKLNRTNFYTDAEFEAAPGGAWLSLFAWAELKSAGVTPERARPLVRAVAGL